MDFSYQAEGRLKMLKGRSKRCCCRYCGGALELKSILFSEFIEARVELYCPQCDRIEFGAEPEIYQSARYFVEAVGYNCYPELDVNESTKRMNIARICDIINDDGFCHPVKLSRYFLGECTLLSDEDLEEVEET